MNKILVFIPTYEEVENVSAMCERIMALPLPLDLHFTDDSSPDGTGKELERLAAIYPRVTVSHRPGKLGIGSAHQAGIAYAYAKGYDFLITMDCDFTHDPSRIPDLIQNQEGFDVVIGSRYMERHSLPGWSLFRRFLTNLGHFLTRNLLRMKYDATGAFRLYNLKRVPHNLFKAVRSKSYSFFFESLFVLISNDMRIKEISIVLPSRTYGHSKLSFWEAYKSSIFLLRLSVERLVNPGRFQIGREVDKLDDKLKDPQNWAPYWQRKKEVSGLVYEVIAAVYRNWMLRPLLKGVLRRTFKKGDKLLHAGCGSGQVDTDIQNQFQITAVDISVDALDLYSRYNPGAFRIEQASILELPYADGSFDGIYNLGVLEHFERQDIDRILREFHRVLKPQGQIVIFWPHRYSTSVCVLKMVQWLFQTIWNKEVVFHPAEVSLAGSRREVEGFLNAASFELAQYRMDLRDGFIQAVVVGKRKQEPTA